MLYILCTYGNTIAVLSKEVSFVFYRIPGHKKSMYFPRKIFIRMETSPLPVKGFNFDLYLALMSIEQLGFLSMPHFLCHGASVYNDHYRRPLTRAERFAVELSLSVVRRRSAGVRTPNLPHTWRMH